ncbi:MAG: hypothetical protein CVT72_06565 [Alphaproteobacteria bacterium HGW-Alphaproteobacteria-11]|nr:MAG: hypothetical protein CVT72_06565 [Alphaproteobacteria bacterium HGW-Alphaproteobacteria-11]
MVVNALNSHPEIRCHGELMQKGNEDLKGALKVVREIDPVFADEAYRHSNPYQFIDSVFALGSEARFQGFKLMLRDNAALLPAIVEDATYAKVLLYRDNVLAAYSSHKIAQVTGQGIVWRFEEVKTAKVPFDGDEFQKFKLRWDKAFAEARRLLAASGQAFLEIEYREASTDAGRRRILEFIGANPEAEIKVRTKKRSASEILDRFTNPGDAEAWLKANDLLRWKIEDSPLSSLASVFPRLVRQSSISEIFRHVMGIGKAAKDGIGAMRGIEVQQEAKSVEGPQPASGAKPRSIKRHFHILPQQGILYVSVPKVACTTLKVIFARLALGVADYVPERIHDNKMLPFCDPEEFGIRNFPEGVNDSGLKRFAFVRNPYTRVLSAYLDKFVSKPRERERLKAARARYLSELGFSAGKEITFAEFVEAVSRQPRVEMDAHWRPQADLLALPTVKYDFVGRLESFRADFLALESFLGVDLQSLYVAKDGKKTGAANRLADYYTPEIKAQVDRIYADDFEFLGFPKELPL